MKTHKSKLSACAFCAEYGGETRSGRITFAKRVVTKFLKTYTNSDYADFNAFQLSIIRSWMTDLHNLYIARKEPQSDLPDGKMELPKFVYK